MINPRGYCHIWASNTGMCCCEGCGFQAVFSGIGYTNQRVCNGNRTQWSPIWSVITRVTQDSNLFNHKYDYSPNWTTRSSVTN